jgi:hypothetical protein
LRLVKAVQGADRPAEFILPINPEFDEEQRRIADALRTLAQLEGRSEESITDEIHDFANAIKPDELTDEEVERHLSVLATQGQS